MSLLLDAVRELGSTIIPYRLACEGVTEAVHSDLCCVPLEVAQAKRREAEDAYYGAYAKLLTLARELEP